MTRLSWCFASLIRWGKYFFSCLLPLRFCLHREVREQQGPESAGWVCGCEWEAGWPQKERRGNSGPKRCAFRIAPASPTAESGLAPLARLWLHLRLFLFLPLPPQVFRPISPPPLPTARSSLWIIKCPSPELTTHVRCQSLAWTHRRPALVLLAGAQTAEASRSAADRSAARTASLSYSRRAGRGWGWGKVGESSCCLLPSAYSEMRCSSASSTRLTKKKERKGPQDIETSLALLLQESLASHSLPPSVVVQLWWVIVPHPRAVRNGDEGTNEAFGKRVVCTTARLRIIVCFLTYLPLRLLQGSVSFNLTWFSGTSGLPWFPL